MFLCGLSHVFQKRGSQSVLLLGQHLGFPFWALLLQATVQLCLLRLVLLFLVDPRIFLSAPQVYIEIYHARIACILIYSDPIDMSLFPALNVLCNGPSDGFAPSLAASNIILCPSYHPSVASTASKLFLAR